MGLARQALLWASQNQWLAKQFQTRAFTRRASRRFLPGEDLESALSATETLGAEGIATLITLLGENVTSAAEAGDVAREYCSVQADIATRSIDCQLSVKPTQLGLDLSSEICRQQLETILQQRTAPDVIVWIDMESAAYVDSTLHIVERLSQTHRNVGVCLQAYLHRTASDVQRLIRLRVPVRLVKGAYREPASVAIQNKADVDRNYASLAEIMLGAAANGEGGYSAFGTHDMSLIARIRDAAGQLDVTKDSYEFEMLYGIAREGQQSLANEGYRVRVLVSYGSAWFPWYMRRLAERPANVWFVVKSLVAR
ncbi:MAG: proline dehydrogenase family protein [Gemmatimonadota bacterium]|nr:MAG: proline dehydrogenase family protein [Gemmatimonadota bacterium]